jgi:hypothetical protein
MDNLYSIAKYIVDEFKSLLFSYCGIAMSIMEYTELTFT